MKDILRLHNLYIGVTKCAIGDGATCCFWIDPWSKNILEAKFPRIASYAKDTMISVRGVLKVEELDELSSYHYQCKSQGNFRTSLLTKMKMIAGSPSGEVIIPLRTSIPIFMTPSKHIPFTKQFGH
jgi:hypothetical protein